MQATRDTNGRYAFVYFPAADLTARLELGQLHAARIRAWWYDPRTGVGTLIGMIDGDNQREFRSPSYGPDWVLVLDNADISFTPPGLAKWHE